MFMLIHTTRTKPRRDHNTRPPRPRMFTIELADATRGPVRAKTREKLKSGVAAWEWVAFLAGQMRSCSVYGVYG